MALFTVEIDVTLDGTLNDELEDELRAALFDAASAALQHRDASGDPVGATTGFDDDAAVVLVVVDADSPAGAEEAGELVVQSVLSSFVARGDLDGFDLDSPYRVEAGRTSYDEVAGLDTAVDLP